MSAESWKVTLPCSRAEAEALAADTPAVFADLDEPPVLMTSEPDPARPEEWRLDAYLDHVPDTTMLHQLLSLVPSARPEDLRIEHVPAQDWVTLSQRDLRPITAGRFHVYTAAHADTLRPGQIGLRIEAGQAFGTGQHETTAGCLAMLDRLAEDGQRVTNALDLGTGSGILALAIAKRWPAARVIASDIDPVSIAVAAENVAVNDERVGDGTGEIALVVADGMQAPELQGRSPYDLVTANILAAPLIAMAENIAGALAPGGVLLLAGLLAHQADAVTAAYRAAGCRLARRHDVGDWPTLVLTRD